ncbi:hypothetical protein BJ546DRAFT_674301 [Cryomyces antarcticus]
MGQWTWPQRSWMILRRSVAGGVHLARLLLGVSACLRIRRWDRASERGEGRSGEKRLCMYNYRSRYSNVPSSQALQHIMDVSHKAGESKEDGSRHALLPNSSFTVHTDLMTPAIERLRSILIQVRRVLATVYDLVSSQCRRHQPNESECGLFRAALARAYAHFDFKALC